MSGATMTQEEFANLSDDEIMNMAEAPVLAPAANTNADPTDQGNQDEGGQENADPAADSNPGSVEGDDGAAGSDDQDGPGSDNAGAAGDGDPAEDPDGAGGEGDGKSPKPAGDSKPEDKAQKPGEDGKSVQKSEDKAVDYKAAYEQIMAPFKANGKEIKLESPDEVIRLMQMGANYTKKLQALQPNLKLLKMLENNGLLDEGKLSYLIDIERKDPKAIQKLLRDSGIDPMDIDTSVEPTYKPGNHKVSDEEMRFTTALEEASSDPAGKNLIVEINKTWDGSSKNALYQDPNILRVLTEQKQNGIYDQVTAEIDRRKLLGTIPENEPFIQVYYRVGQELTQKGVLTPKNLAPASTQTSRVVETRQAPTSKTVTNSDKARAASPTRTAPKKVAQDFNPLAMSDEDFEKNQELAKRL